MRRRPLLLLIAAFGICGMGSGARAQDRLVDSPDQVRECLCLSQTADARREQATQQKGGYDALTRQLDTQRAEIETRRKAVKADSPTAERDTAQVNKLIAAYNDDRKKLLDRKASYEAAVAGYNKLVEQYRARCDGVKFDRKVVDEVQASLSCPGR